MTKPLDVAGGPPVIHRFIQRPGHISVVISQHDMDMSGLGACGIGGRFAFGSLANFMVSSGFKVGHASIPLTSGSTTTLSRTMPGACGAMNPI